MYIHSSLSIITHDISTTVNNWWCYTPSYSSKILKLSYSSTPHSIQPDRLFIHILVFISHIGTLYHHPDAVSPCYMGTRYHPYNAVSLSGPFVLKSSNPPSSSFYLKLPLIYLTHAIVSLLHSSPSKVWH